MRNVPLLMWGDEAVEVRAIRRSELGADDEDAFGRIGELEVWPGLDRLLVLARLAFLVDCELPGRVLPEVGQGEIGDLLSEPRGAPRLIDRFCARLEEVDDLVEGRGGHPVAVAQPAEHGHLLFNELAATCWAQLRVHLDTCSAERAPIQLSR